MFCLLKFWCASNEVIKNVKITRYFQILEVFPVILSTYFVYLFCLLILSTYFVYLFCLLILSTYFVYLFCLLILSTYFVYLFCLLILSTYFVYLFCLLILSTYFVYLFCLLIYLFRSNCEAINLAFSNLMWNNVNFKF